MDFHASQTTISQRHRVTQIIISDWVSLCDENAQNWWWTLCCCQDPLGFLCHLGCLCINCDFGKKEKKDTSFALPGQPRFVYSQVIWAVPVIIHSRRSCFTQASSWVLHCLWTFGSHCNVLKCIPQNSAVHIQMGTDKLKEKWWDEKRVVKRNFFFFFSLPRHCLLFLLFPSPLAQALLNQFWAHRSDNGQLRRQHPTCLK